MKETVEWEEVKNSILEQRGYYLTTRFLVFTVSEMRFLNDMLSKIPLGVCILYFYSHFRLSLDKDKTTNLKVFSLLRDIRLSSSEEVTMLNISSVSQNSWLCRPVPWCPRLLAKVDQKDLIILYDIRIWRWAVCPQLSATFRLSFQLCCQSSKTHKESFGMRNNTHYSVWK